MCDKIVACTVITCASASSPELLEAVLKLFISAFSDLLFPRRLLHNICAMNPRSVRSQDLDQAPGEPHCTMHPSCRRKQQKGSMPPPCAGAATLQGIIGQRNGVLAP